MRPFTFETAQDMSQAMRAMRDIGGSAHVTAPSQFLAGGTTLLDLMKLDVMRPTRLVDINALDKATATGRIEVSEQGLRLGALVRMTDAAEHDAIKRDYPVIAQSLSLAASSGLRNMASLGGNLLQRTRCNYFRDTACAECNKRTPGSGCAALDGFNRSHAVLGTSDACIATYPGDFAQALLALDATLEVHGASGARALRVADLHRRPHPAPDVETNLRPGELIVALHVPASALTRRSVYTKVRDRQSYEFALASAAVALDLDGQTVRQARIALGGVATVPWRATAAEAGLIGQPLTEAAAQAAADKAFEGAQARAHNAYKIPLGKATIVRALMHAATMEV